MENSNEASAITNVDESRVRLENDGVRSAISHACMLFGPARPEKDTPAFIQVHANRHSGALNMVSFLTGNKVVTVALCLDCDTVQGWPLVEKNFDVPACYINTVDSTQGILTRFAENQYKKFCNFEREKMLEFHRQANGKVGTTALYSNTEVMKATRFPDWKDQIQKDYGEVARYFHKLWYLNPDMDRVEVFNMGMSKMMAQCKTKDGLKKIIKEVQTEKRQEQCVKELKEILDDSEVVRQKGRDCTVVKDNDKFQKLLATYFSLFNKGKYNKTAPDLLLCFKEFLGSADVEVAHQNTFEGFLEFEPRYTTEYLDKCHEIQEKINSKAIQEQKKCERDRIKLQNEVLRETKRKAKEAEARERDERKKLAKSDNISDGIAKAVAVATGTGTVKVAPHMSILDLGDIPEHTDEALNAPRLRLDKVGNAIMQADGISYAFTEPGSKWVERMRKGVLAVHNFVDSFLLGKGLEASAFVDSKIELNVEAAHVLMAIMFVQEESPVGTNWFNEDHKPWRNNNFHVFEKNFLIYARQTIGIWLDGYFADRLPSTFAAFANIVSHSDTCADNGRKWDQIKEILDGREFITKSQAKYIKKLCNTLLKIQYIVDAVKDEWPDDITMDMPQLVTLSRSGEKRRGGSNVAAVDATVDT